MKRLLLLLSLLGARAAAQDVPDASAPLSDEALAAAIEARFADEPGVLEVVRRAIEVAGLDPELAHARVRRGRRSGLLPDLRLAASRQRGIDVAARQTTETTSTQTGQADAFRLEASLTFSLSRLLYGPDEVAWSREERAIVDAIASLTREVIEAFFRRRRLVIEVELLGLRDAEHLVALAEADALLEVFTAGAFFRIMAVPNGTP